MTEQRLFPCLSYDKAPAAIDFLCQAFGFKKHAIYAHPDDPTQILHAQLLLDGTMLMLGSAIRGEKRTAYKILTPQEAGGVTACLCVYVADPDAHYANAVAHGAEIVTHPHDNDGYPGRSYDARDPEGNLWNFSSYNPWVSF